MRFFYKVIFFAVCFFFCTPIWAKEVPISVTMRYEQEARKTIEIGVSSIMKEMDSTRQLCDTVDYFIDSWGTLTESELFVLKNDTDLDVYGNLYSLQVMCRTLLLAVQDWNEAEPGKVSDEYLEKAERLDHKARLQADPVAEILSRQSYNDYLALRVEIMKKEFDYVKKYYELNPFKDVAAR